MSDCPVCQSTLREHEIRNPNKNGYCDQCKSRGIVAYLNPLTRDRVQLKTAHGTITMTMTDALGPLAWLISRPTAYEIHAFLSKVYSRKPSFPATYFDESIYVMSEFMNRRFSVVFRHWKDDIEQRVLSFSMTEEEFFNFKSTFNTVVGR